MMVNMTVPPVILPLSFLALLWWVFRRWLPGLVKAKHSKAEVYGGLIVVPCVAFGLTILLLHFAGGASAHLAGTIGEGLRWCVQGLLWDCFHPFAYGFHLSF
jgi:hypothetical protein